MQNAKQWGAALTIVAVLIGVLAYQAKNDQLGLVVAKSDIDFSALHPNNPGCSIISPDGVALDVPHGRVIPKGTFITGSCFVQKKF